MFNLWIITFAFNVPLWTFGDTYPTYKDCVDQGTIIWEATKTWSPQTQIYIGCLPKSN